MGEAQKQFQTALTVLSDMQPWPTKSIFVFKFRKSGKSGPLQAQEI